MEYTVSDLSHFSANEFQEFRDFLQDAAGIDLGLNKQYLVATRVRRILINQNLTTLADLTHAIRNGSNIKLRQQVIDAMTTNETFWFRDLYPFEYLTNHILPEFKDSGRRRFRLWSAACSYGQEPYSIAIVIEEFIRSHYSLRDFPCEILATDLSSIVLDAAARGCYDRLSVSRGLEGGRLREYFEQIDADTWQVKSEVRERVSFRQQNLLDSYTLLGKFDAVFCRNVLIYFSSELKHDILRRIHRSLNKGGYLIMGSSESLGDVSELFDTLHVRPGVVYRAR